ncbi:ATP-binding protein [Flagellimonas sp. HMM57]|uniref:ATP-binding response regulator n=1 Tax=unclassified Flagellimonas TaxID=2644544 RepID=UPI0013D68F29|nr:MULTISPECIES: ATP-binding protein [unclassified Flagellimonas]UII74531.1 ATP-binding protein [Flagellimonas sp. HMM57]
MYPKSKRRFTFKIITSYLVLGVLAFLAAFFVYSEFQDYNASQSKEEDNIKLLKTNSLLTELYEAENLSKLALQTKERGNLTAYAQKVDTIFNSIDSLKLLTTNDNQIVKLDSVQKLLQQKVYNNAELRNLKVRNTKSAPIDSLLKKFNKMEVDMGRITPETFAPNFEQLSPETQNSIKKVVAILNKNIPSEDKDNAPTADIDSLLQLSKSLLERAKLENARIERSVIRKELQIYKADLELSQKLRSMISAFEKEIIMNAYLDNLNKEQILKRSVRLTGIAVILGLIVVSLFTFLIIRDFWKVQRYREQLEKEKKYSESLLKSREQLISTVSHDLRTPLNTIGGYTELMEHSNLGTNQQQYVRNIKSASKYVDNLVNDLLDFSKLESGKIQIEKVPFLLSHLIADTASGFEDIYHKKFIVFSSEIPEALEKPIIGDPFRVRQILTNLLGNAFKFTDKGFVKVKARVRENDSGPLVNITVIDSGIGIKKEQQERIFKEFAQASDSIEKKYGGYGLGLTISKKLTSLLGGTLYLESEENKGSAFTLSLPLKFSDTEITTEDTQHSNLKNQPSLLIFDDDETLLELLQEVCKIHHMPAKVFSNFEDAEHLDDFHYDVVLTDIQMPVVNGYEVVKRLKSGHFSHYENQPIVAMTGQRNVDKKSYLDNGFSEVLPKPFSHDALLNTLNTILDYGNQHTPEHSLNENTVQSNSKLFSLEIISSFLDSPKSVYEVLESFLEDTHDNLYRLSIAVENLNYDEIKSISHKMLPMFRQLKVESAIPILEKLEHLSYDATHKKTIRRFEKLKLSILNLETAIHAFLPTLPVDID